MGFMRGRGLWTVVAVVALLATGLARPAVAAPPEGVQIGQAGSCLVREGGTQGYRINYQFEWFYADTASLGPNLTQDP